jgi:streptomycin 6-kinase
MSNKPLMKRVEERIDAWRIAVQDTLETPSSFVVYGTRGNQPVVLKVLRQPGDEWRSGSVLDAFKGKGIVKVYEYMEGAVLLERLHPGTSLAAIALADRDEEATEIITEVIQQMVDGGNSDQQFPTTEDWGKGFEGYFASGDQQIARSLVEQGQTLYAKLCASQQARRLLHGDLQHYNILFDSQRGWTAIDPKGVVGEIEYELGASLRNPYEEPELFASPKTIESRLKYYESKLKIDFNRALEWGFAQAVLSAIWTIEDGFEVKDSNPSMMLANAMQPMLD